MKIFLDVGGEFLYIGFVGWERKHERKKTMAHEWTIKKVQSELETLRKCNEGYRFGNDAIRAAIKTINEGTSFTQLPEDSHMARLVKSKVRDFQAVLVSLAPFGQKRIENKHVDMLSDMEQNIKYYEEKVIPANETKIHELEQTLALLKANQ